MTPRRIVSLLPAATEMIYLLGLADRLVGRSHECDYPPEVVSKPVVSDCAIDMTGLTAAEIDLAVSARSAAGKSLYAVDEAALRRAAPDLLVTQNLCQVCGPAGREVSQVIAAMDAPPEILWQSPRSIEQMFDAIRSLARATQTEERAVRWIGNAAARLARVAAVTERRARVRVAFLEWLDPLYGGGHWIPQMLHWAGAEDRNSQSAADSVRLAWSDVLDFKPAVVLIAPCGFNTDAAVAQANVLHTLPGWTDLPAVRNDRVYAVDANSYFARPGPRLIDGVELVAHLVHPEVFTWAAPQGAFARVHVTG